MSRMDDSHARRSMRRDTPSSVEAIVERVARAIFEARVDGLGPTLACREMTASERVTYTRLARAAIKALGVDP